MLKNRQIARICRKKHKSCVKPAKITYLHNAQGQRVFKSEPRFAQALPDETEVGTDFITWLKKNFGWLYATAQTNATLGQSYVYADGQLPEYALLAEYGNGAASGAGRLEYIWLPTDSGGAIPIGVYRGSRFYAIHADHLNTPRLMTDDSNKAVWQWPYSAFGDNKPTGVLKATASPNNAVTQDQTTNALLKATNPAVKFNLRFPGQYADDESNLNQNFNRSYQFGQGRYSQSDPIGLDGGLNRFAYAEQNPLSFTDPLGLAYFAKRPLAGSPWLGPLSSNPIDDYFNIEISHEQLFFEDGKSPSNIGFFGDSTLKTEPNPTGYKTRSGKFDDCIMRKAVAATKTPAPYCLIGSNCQTWAKMVRKEYTRLERDPLVKKECECLQ